MLLRKTLLIPSASLILISSLISCTSPAKETATANKLTSGEAIMEKPATSSELLSPALQKAIQLNNKGLDYFNAGKYPKALKLYQQALTINEKVLGKLHPSTANSYNNIGITYDSMGDYPKTLELYQQALTIREKVLGKLHPDTATSYHNIGGTYQSMGDYPKALELYQQALTIREKVLGKLHPDTATSYHNIGGTYQSMGDYPKALELYQQALTIREKVLGKLHPDTASSYNNIGGTYGSMGDYPKALELFQQALTIKEKVLGKLHPDTAISYHNIGATYQSMGDYPKALELYQQALTIKEKVLGKLHPSTANSYNNIGITYGSMGDYPKALELFQQALTIREKVLGKLHPYTASSYNNIGATYQLLGNYPKALELFQQALTIREKVLGKLHPDTATSYHNIGGTYGSMGDYPKALELFQQALTIEEKVLGKLHPDTATSYQNIGGTYRSMGDYPKALELFQQALTIREKVLGKLHPYTAISYNNIGLTYQSMGNYPKALELYQQALTIEEKVLGKLHPDTATNYHNIGATYGSMGDYPKALELFQQALTIKEKVLGKLHPDTATIYHNIGATYKSMGDYPQAYQYITGAFAIYLQNQENTFSGLNTQQKRQYLKSTDHYINNLLNVSTAYMLDLQKQDKQAKFKQVRSETTNHWLAYKSSIIDNEQRLLSFARSSNNPKVKQKYQQLIELKRRYAKLRQITPKPTQKAQWQQQHQQLKQNMTRLQYEIAKQDPRFKQAIALNKITAEQVSSILKPSELYLDFAWVGDTYYIFTITREGVTFNALNLADSKAINTGVRSFSANIQKVIKHPEQLDALKAQSRQSLTKLYELLMTQELRSALENKTELIISPDGALRLLPFESLYDKAAAQYLIEQKDIRYITSGRELVRVSKLRNQLAKTPQAVIFANPNYGGIQQKSRGKDVDTSAMSEAFDINRALPDSLFPVPALAGTHREAENIKKILTSPRPLDYQGDAATESQLLAVKSPKILHIATHGFFDADSIDPMLQSGLLLAGANTSKQNNQDDGIVTALKLSNIKLTGTDLVVLSACETGKVDPDNTSGISGLTKAFIQAGAKNVIMSLWKVSDDKTALLMERLYQRAKDNNGNYAQALKQSKLKMVEDDLHPYYWAGFVLSGL